MDNYMGIIMIAAACIFVLLIGAFRNKKEWINGFLVSQGLSIAIGINPITVLTSGVLGFPGLVMLYGINLYKLL